jgi:SAM-dependent methyltransferase
VGGVSDTSAFLYADGRFRRLGEPRVELPPSALSALDEAHQKLVEHPDAVVIGCLCGTSADIRVAICDRHGLPLSLVLCRSCGLIRANPQPNAEQLAWFYSRVYRGLYGPFAANEGALFDGKRWKGRLVLAALQSAGVSLPSGPVVDLGCGGGWTLAAFSEAGHTCIGFDFDERWIGIGQKRGLDLRLGGAEQARRAQVQAGLLILSHVLEHVLDPENELRQLRPLLMASGLLYIEVPHTRRIGGVALRNDSLRYWQRAHLWDFQRSHLSSLAERAGYDVLWSSEDENSVFLLCGVGKSSGASSWPRVGPQVQAQLLGFESRHQSRAQRLVNTALTVYSERLRPLRGLFR